MYKTCSVIFLLLLTCNLRAQNAVLDLNYDTTTKPTHLTLGIELFGNAGLYAINFEEVIFRQRKHAVSYRIAGSYLGNIDPAVPSVPRSIIFLTGLNYQLGSEKFHFCLGIIPGMIITTNELGNREIEQDFSPLLSFSAGPRILVKREVQFGLSYVYYPFSNGPLLPIHSAGLSIMMVVD